MSKNIVLYIFIVLFSFVTVSCAETGNKGIEITDTNSNANLGTHKLFFWRVRSKVSTVYILGSIFAGSKKMFPLDEMIEMAFDASDTLVVEIDPEKIDKEKIKNYIEYPTDDALRNHISQSLYYRLVNMFSSFGVPEMKFNKMKPAAAVTTLVMLKLASMGYDPEFAIDKYYLDDAREKKNILQLETPEKQLVLMNNLGEDYIEYVLQDMSRWNKEIKILINAWKTGNTKMVDNFFQRCANYPGGEEFVEKFIYKRSEDMAKKIQNYLKSEGRYFVIVGAEHLVGEFGIINLLKETGKYQVVQLSDFNNE